jgi:hypothetical protein
LLALMSLGSIRLAGAAPAQGRLDFSSTYFTILSTTDAQVVGRAHYFVDQVNGASVLRGDNRYLDGTYDLESDTLEVPPSGATPTLMAYEHLYFNRDGSPSMVTRADFRTDSASCVRYENGSPETESAKLDFPPDTYAGAGIIIPLEYGLRKNPQDLIHLHFFSCVPAPRVVSVEADPRAGLKLPGYTGDVIAVDVRGRLGWWDLFLRPFIPKIRAWFDPSNRFIYLGGEIQRYYRGPRVELVREPNPRSGATPGATPAK